MTFVKKAAPGGPVNTEAVVGQAAASLKQAATAITTATETVAGLGSAVDDLVLKINNKSNNLAALDQEYAEKERQLTIDLNATMQEKANVKVAEHLAGQGKTAISNDELNGLKTSLTKWQTDYDKDVKAAVGAAVGQANAAHAHETALLKAQNAQANAELTFEVKSLKALNDQLNAQVQLLTTQLNDERAAGIKRAEAASVGAVNINNDRK